MLANIRNTKKKNQKYCQGQELETKNLIWEGRTASSQLEIYKLELDKQVEDGNIDFMIIAD